MAAPIAVVAIEKLIQMSLQQLANEACSLLNFRKDLKWVTEELTFTKAYLKDAYHKSTQNEAVKQWLRDLHEVAFDLEDILDECDSLSRAFSCSCLIFKYKIGRRIRKLKDRMKFIVDRVARLQLLDNLPSTEEASTSLSRADKSKRSSLLESNVRPVAIEAKVNEILRLLDDATHNVIGVVGMGGVGKTFLLQHVYNDRRTTSMFDKCIWLSISQTYSLQKLQSDLASSLYPSASTSAPMASTLALRDVVRGHLSEQRSVEVIRGSLHEKKILIVLDDVWGATEQHNLVEKLGIPIATTQCKIVLTTRSMEVCTKMNASLIYRVELLTEEESWNLFCMYAFYPENMPPNHLKDLARQVESKCGKLPLALKIVGACMANQTRADQWESMLRKLKAVKKSDDLIMEILRLSYDFLPAELKACFLYFSFFGEDEEIDVDYLIELWRAEGFIPEGDDGREIGLNCYYQLSNLCLVEARETEDLHKYCKIHDLLRDLAISICNENKCGFTLQEGCIKYSWFCTQYLYQLDKSSGCRRIFLAKQGMQDDDISDGILFPTFLRTLSLRENDKIKNIPSSLFSKVRALRVLDLSNTDISTLPNSIGRLKLLKVLNLLGTNINDVPQCIRSLKNLLVLRIWGSNSIKRVPDWIGELKCLESLALKANSMTKTISKLPFLRALFLPDLQLSVMENGLLRLEDVGNLIDLQELYVEIDCEAELQRMEGGVLERLVRMRELGIVNKISRPVNGVDARLFPEKLTSMKHLEVLRLHRFVVPSSSWICEFVNLTLLVLRDCDCSEYPALESLPNLISLVWIRNQTCREVSKSFGKCGAFPKLRFLKIDNFPMLKEFPMLEGGSMPCLENLSLTYCTRVRRVPEGLEQLKSLRAFDFRESGTDECREKLKEEGEEWKKIKANNPLVQIYI